MQRSRVSSSSTPDASGEVVDTTLEARVERIRERAAHELVPRYVIFGWVLSAALLWVLHSRVSGVALGIFMLARLLTGGIRWRYSWSFLRRDPEDQHSSMPTYRWLVTFDSVTWGMLGWGVTPIQHTEVAAVTIAVMIAVTSLGTFMLQVDRLSAPLFIVPILLPNSLYALTRGDDLGIFASLALLAMLALLLREAIGAYRRTSELMCLRFQSEEVAQAQSRALAQARSLSEAKSRFVATMSHEMRTPLHGILGLVRLMRARGLDAQSDKQLELIRGSGDHLLNVINDVLDFSAMEAGSLPLHEQRFNLPELISEVVELSRVTAEDKGLRLEVVLDVEHGVDVMGDPVRVRQILHNLLGNAIKFTHEGRVQLRAARRQDGAVAMEVEDTGIGIEASELPHVFDAFHQAEGTYRRRFGGTGLGLTISRDLCRAMGGDLVCRSQVGRGSVFTFSLPLPVVEGAPEAETVPAELGLSLVGVPHVLLVEDNPVNALVAEAELRRLGVNVTIKDNGREAVAWLEQQTADLVLMDCEMPEMDGFEATRRIRERERRTGSAPVNIVALTANGLETYVQRCVVAGMNDHLAKPFRSDDLARMLARHLGLAECPA